MMASSRSIAPALIRAAGAGELAPDIALMRLIMETRSAAELEKLLDCAIARTAQGDPAGMRLREVARLFRLNPASWNVVRKTAAVVPHDLPREEPRKSVARLAAAFDAAARISPEASVALYSLGDPERLGLATGEIVAFMRAIGLIDARHRYLDLGCGIGRLAADLAPRVGSVVGIDIAPEMLRLARERTSGLANVEIRLGSGLDLSGLADGAFDCVVALDSFPYFAGELAARHIDESARVLKPGGALLILNFSYGGSPEDDRREIARLGGLFGFEVVRNGVSPFRHWDGLAFHLVKPRGSSPAAASNP